MKKQYLLLFIGIAINYAAVAQIAANAQKFGNSLKTHKHHLQTKSSEFLSRSQTKNKSFGARELVPIYDSIRRWNWNDTTSNYQNSIRVFPLTYNGPDITSEQDQQWNGNAWANYLTYTYTYDANHNELTEAGQTWNGTAWVNSTQMIMTYNGNNDMLTMMDQDWNGTSWDNVDNMVNTYDVNNNLINNMMQVWNGSAWDNLEQQTAFVYDINNNCLSYIIQDWNGSSWVNVRRVTETYDANNNMLTEFYENWNGNAWVNYWNYAYVYDAFNNCTSYIEQLWNGTAWVNQYKVLLTYDANINATGYINQVWNGTAFINNYQEFYRFDVNDIMNEKITRTYSNAAADWINIDSTYFYYTATVGIQEQLASADNIIVAPNPFSAETTIVFATEQKNTTLKIMDGMGKEILKQVQNDTKRATIDMSGYAKGIYFIRIEDKDKNMTIRKMVLQ